MFQTYDITLIGTENNTSVRMTLDEAEYAVIARLAAAVQLDPPKYGPSMTIELANPNPETPSTWSNTPPN